MRHQIGKFLDTFAPQLSTKARKYLDQKRLKGKAVQTPQGFLFSGNTSMQQGTFEPVETEIIQHLLENTKLFINIGANIGYYCCLALSKEVYTLAFEPVQVNLQLLQANLSNNHFSKSVELFPVALGDSTGIVKIYGDGTGASIIPGWAGASHNYFNYVPLNTLDNLLKSRIVADTLILMDIEGGEYSALLGAREILDYKNSAIWFVEICISEHQPEGVSINPNLRKTFDLFWNAGYQAYTAQSKPLLVTSEAVDMVVHNKEDIFETHNFVFLPNGRTPSWMN